MSVRFLQAAVAVLVAFAIIHIYKIAIAPALTQAEAALAAPMGDN